MVNVIAITYLLFHTQTLHDADERTMIVWYQCVPPTPDLPAIDFASRFPFDRVNALEITLRHPLVPCTRRHVAPW
jgi:hypothetical protein